MSHSGRMLFCGTTKGTLWSMKFPLNVPGEWTEHQGHGAAITKVRPFASIHVLVYRGVYPKIYPLLFVKKKIHLGISNYVL